MAIEKGFTLAEILISLAVIGIVAMLTIPALVKNYQDRAWSTASQVFERKLEEALKSMNTQETLAGYSTTKDFVNEFSKHIKITKICNNDDLTSCFSDKVYWGADKEEIDISKIKNAKNFGQENWGTENIGIQFSNGVNGIIAYNPACTQDPFNNQFTGIDCIALLYDISGFKLPNTYLADLMAVNISSLNDNNCVIKLSDGTCLSAPFHPQPLTNAECLKNQEKWGIKNCREGDDDYWGGAVKACNGVQNMATSSNIYKLGSDYFYVNDSNLNTELAIQMGFITTPGDFYIWTNKEKSQKVATDLHFTESTIYTGLNFERSLSSRLALCVVK